MPTKVIDGKRVKISQDEHNKFRSTQRSGITQRQQQLKNLAKKQYNTALMRGFAFDGGTFPAAGPKRKHVIELMVNINSGIGMPNNKSTKQFFDLEGNSHEFTKNQILDLAEKGSILIDVVDDHYEELIKRIDGTTSHSDLDKIEIYEGWPEKPTT